MKLTAIGPSYPFKGGISHFNSLLCMELSKHHDVQLIGYKKIYPSILYPGKTQFDSSKNKIAFPCIAALSLVNPVTWLRASLIIRKFRPKILLMHWYSPLFSPLYSTIGALTKIFAGSKIVLLCHNLIPPEKRPFDSFFENLFFRLVDVFIAPTAHDSMLIKRKYPLSRVMISPHPDYRVFDYGKFSRKSAKKKLNLTGKTILIFGYMRGYKGLSNLLHAMPIVLKKQKLTLVAAGEVWGKAERYKEIARRLGISKNVIFIDRYVDNEEIEIFFKACDAVIAPYLSPTNSGVIQLAFSFGKPVIATNVRGFREIIGDRGILVKCNSPKEIAEAVLTFYNNRLGPKIVANIRKQQKMNRWSRLSETITSCA